MENNKENNEQQKNKYISLYINPKMRKQLFKIQKASGKKMSYGAIIRNLILN